MDGNCASPMPSEAKRRSHKKSRKGCHECKKRHVKCDETRPSCVSCETASIRCSFKHEAPSARTTRRGSSTPAAAQYPPAQPTPQYQFRGTGLPSPFSHNHDSQQTPPRSPFEPGTLTTDEFDLNMTHLQLLHHFSTHTVLSFRSSQQPHPLATVLVRAALSEPYLLSVLLAFSALHRSAIQPEARAFYQNQAHGLQTRALSLFNKNERIDITAENCLQRFLFASFLGLHLLCDVVSTCDQEFGQFLDQFVSYMKVHRGVRAVSGESWQMLLETEIRDVLLETAERRKEANASNVPVGVSVCAPVFVLARYLILLHHLTNCARIVIATISFRFCEHPT